MVNERSQPSTSTLARNNLQKSNPVTSNSHSTNTTHLKSIKIPELDFPNVDPDSLFVKYTISEIKAIQARLTAEADAKQEELRLMVGERYRDLLQSSTSIIAMDEASRRVVDGLYQMKKTTTSVQEHKPPRVAIQREEDSYLKTLQSLAAHMKLLLDAPESLWRFLERKEYLNATWLFLLSRVVHRALTNESLAEVPWRDAGINIQTQFPLAQRQWDLITQFRPQIAHRATQFLKESSVSSDTACTTLLSLHLLNSSPLTETLSTLLSQRSRTLGSLLDSQWHANFIAPEEKSKDPSKRKVLVNNLQKALLDAIDVVCGTMCIARDVFQVNENSTCSMIEQHLEDFQSGDPSKPLVTTPSLLSTLPSSAHLSALPRTILSFKPYIDLSSPSAHVDPLVLDFKLSSWFEKALSSFDGQIQGWLGELININEVWSTRNKILVRLKTACRLKELERAGLQNVVDNGVRTRIIQLLNSALENLEDTLQRSLQKILQAVKDNSDQSDADPSFMFSSPELPSITQIENSSTMSPFHRYKASIRHRIDGRTSFLVDIQQSIETQASQIRADLDIIQSSNNEAPALQQQVMESYEDSLLSSSSRLSEILETFVQRELTTNEAYNLDTFIGRLCYHLSQSRFLRELQFTPSSDQTPMNTFHRLQDQCIESWRGRTVLKALDAYQDMFVMELDNDQLTHSLPTQPSSCLITVLVIINSALNDLGLPKHEIVAKRIPKRLLASFGSAIAEKIPVENVAWHPKQLQLLWDITFFLRLQPQLMQECSSLVEKLVSLRIKLESVPDDRYSDAALHLDRSTSAYLLRSQTLLGPLIDLPSKAQNGTAIEKSKTFLKAKPTSLLRLGTPDVEQEYTPALGIAKPSIRFAMLSIDSTGGS